MGVKERRDREKVERSTEILDAAESVIFEKGFENATMEEVASKAELSKGTLYLYFKSKEEIYLAIRLRAIRKLFELFSEAVNRDVTGLEKVRRIGEAYFSFAHDYPNYFDSLLHFEDRKIELIGDFPLTRESFEVGAKVNYIVSSAVAQGIKDGSIRAELQPEITGMLLWALSSGFVQLVTRHQDVVT